MKAHVLCGLDRPALYHDILSAKRVGLMTNQTGIDHLFRPAIDIIHKNYRLNVLMGVEHGVRGDIQAGEHVGASVDKKTGVPVVSLYGDTRRPTSDLMKEMDIAVYDIQDVGARFYTYLYSLSYLMEACAENNVPLVVMDRLNPLGGLKTEGTILDESVHSFVGEYAIPTRYAMTVGEYALFVRKHLKLDIDLTIIPLEGWRRSLYLDDTDTPWVAPSPNCATLNAAQCFIGTCLFEGTNLSEGRGTTQPFELVGAPWVDVDKLADTMKKLAMPGIHFRPCTFVPTFSKHQGVLCRGVQMHVTDRSSANLFAAGLYLLETIRDQNPGDFTFLTPPTGEQYHFDRLLGTKDYRLGKLDADGILREHQPKLEAFQTEVQSLLLYP